MTKTGSLSISNGVAVLDDGTTLARCGDPDPFGAAVGFLGNQQPPIRDGDMITVTGVNGAVNGVVVSA